MKIWRVSPSPGFRLGFPVIQPLYLDQEVGKYAYLLIRSDGSRRTPAGWRFRPVRVSRLGAYFTRHEPEPPCTR